MVAGQNILLLSGTTVASGGTLHAYITTDDQYCNLGAAPVVKSAENQGGKQEVANALSLKIFPNPASAEVVLDLRGVVDGGSAKMEMFGIRGDVLHTGSFAGNGQYPLSLHGIPSGVYYLRIISGDQVITKMLLKR